MAKEILKMDSHAYIHNPSNRKGLRHHSVHGNRSQDGGCKRTKSNGVSRRRGRRSWDDVNVGAGEKTGRTEEDQEHERDG